MKINKLGHLKAIILDRDGVINYDSKLYIKSIDEWVPLPGSIEAIVSLLKAGFKVFIATNQSGLARGYFNIKMLESIHAQMNRMIKLSSNGKFEGVHGIYYCPHGPDDDCNCRKPRSGLVEEILNDHNLHANECMLVGDSLRDLQAAWALNIKTVLVLTGNGIETNKKLASQKISNKNLELNCVFGSLAEWVHQSINK